MLFVFGGLPSSGKSVLSRHLANTIGAVHVRIDSIEQALKDFGNMSELDVQGYVAGYAVAHDNLLLGNDVVADSVNPIEITRSAWRNVGDTSGAEIIEIEAICSDPEEHRTRYEQRVSDIATLKFGPWSSVANREYEVWTTADVRIDTSSRAEAESCEELMQLLADRLPDRAGLSP
jgi:predicted kinase